MSFFNALSRKVYLDESKALDEDAKKLSVIADRCLLVYNDNPSEDIGTRVQLSRCTRKLIITRSNMINKSLKEIRDRIFPEELKSEIFDAHFKAYKEVSPIIMEMINTRPEGRMLAMEVINVEKVLVEGLARVQAINPN